MIDPESLNAFEVLSHLKQLGYQNITGPQLREFMHDLKKLIRYEQKYNTNAGSTSDVDESSADPYSHDSECSGSSSELCTNCNASKSDSACDISNLPSLTNYDKRKKKSATFDEQTIRPKSSFIRPWRLQPSYKGATAGSSLKSDPVQLYHKYKELWAQQKVPGEKSHSQLRWTIREKMLGQDPHPRPISQASTEHRSH